jgi:hypothetical protein
MAFAKLSGSLLASSDPQPQTVRGEPDSGAEAAAKPGTDQPADEAAHNDVVADAVKVSRLYDELRGCIRKKALLLHTTRRAG